MSSGDDHRPDGGRRPYTTIDREQNSSGAPSAGAGAPGPAGNRLKQSGYTFAEVEAGLVRNEEERQLAAVMEIANVINSRLDLDHILSGISRELAKVIDYDIGCVAIYEKDESCLYIRHIVRPDGNPSGEGRYVPLEESNLVGWVAIHKKAILRTDIRSDTRFTEIMKEDNLTSDIVVPLIAKDQLIGTVNIGRYQKRPFTEFDLELVTKFSKLTSIAIEHSQLVRSLEELGEKYRRLMDNATDLIVLIDFSGEIVEANRATYELFGYAPDEVIGKEFFLFTLPNMREEAKRRFFKILQGKPEDRIEFPYVKKGGGVVYLDVNPTVVQVRGNPYVLAIAHDVTERRKLQEKITIKNRELRSVNQKLMEVDQLKSEFLGRISHELRTPLSIIMAYTGALHENDREQITDEIRGDFLTVIENQADKLLGLINDLLDLSKVEISETMLDVGPGSVNEIVRIAVRLVEPYAKQHDITVVSDLDPDLPILNFDLLRIRQTCVNLLNNAVKFTGRGGYINVTTSQTDKEVIVSVGDTGHGIPEELIPTIFENFTQLDGGDARSRDGLGVGLRLVKHYVTLHRGRVWVKSKQGKGSTFYFSLPKSGFNEELTGCADPDAD